MEKKREKEKKTKKKDGKTNRNMEFKRKEKKNMSGRQTSDPSAPPCHPSSPPPHPSSPPTHLLPFHWSKIGIFSGFKTRAEKEEEEE